MDIYTFLEGVWYAGIENKFDDFIFSVWINLEI